MITISDIAKEANVSAGTVDRVIHNRGGVSKKTAEKVKDIMTKHNFKINEVGRSLALNKKLNIATLIPQFDDNNLFWEAPYLGFDKAHDEVRKFGISVTHFSFNQFDIASYEQAFNDMIDSKPDGVIIVPSFEKETKQLIKALDNNNIPYIFINVDVDDCNNLSFIGQNSYASGFLAGKLMHLCLKGEGSILIAQTRLNVGNNHAISERIKGFKDFFTEKNLPVNFITSKFLDLKNTAKLKASLDSFLKEDPSVKGIYVPSSRISFLANCFNDETLNELSLIGFDSIKQNMDCLKNDKVSFLISQEPLKQGFDSIKVMCDFLVDKKTPNNKLYSPLKILAKENAEFI